ncbi:flavodoxin family protein [Flavobacterium taihuense]|uniref:Flavodoxin family protein n=1 Tax=Flavobacterium taihuense TaxID=2857508 RepID=A0ABS6XVB5_9FLAO|nr:flavodoxin family protein [Flavobacterium taihuense]MBW4360615.1 flavodoxin family protein [Flavobacterium taihuense]
MKIVIIYHSGYGHTKIVAEHIQKGASRELEQVFLLSTLEAQDNFDLLHQADTLVFGSPTYMGTISADFKKFMEATGKFWYIQKWKDKFAAGFTNSSTLNGDKLNTLQQLSLFASQHSMLWISTGILPKFENDKQLEEPNGLGSYLGLMTLSDNSTAEVNLPKGLETAELFGQRIAQLTKQFKESK